MTERESNFEMQEFNLRLGRLIADIRKKRNITVRALADQCGAKKKYVRRIERGEFKTMSMYLFFAVAECLKVKPDTLMESLETPEASPLTEMVNKRGEGKDSS